MPVQVGVTSIQGDFEKHIEAFSRLGISARRIREPEDLKNLTHLVLPGGESTTVGMLMERFGLGAAIQEAAKGGLAVWGTCMGMILMAKDIEDREQYSLDLLDITVRRNAFGAQVHSFEDTVAFKGLPSQVTGVFIRAPIVTRLGTDVKTLARYEDKVVAVRQGKRLGTSFHPELTDDDSLHSWFLEF
ncbi:MAG: pyridoxal 5'-phosphate synthase glutaminase subunit PdxT [Armatimonadota bacterium]